MKGYYQILIFVVLAAYPFSVLAFEEPLPGSTSSGERELLLPEEPLPGSSGDQESLLPEDTASDAYGLTGGYIHPYITLSGEYTDNLFNVDTNKKTNFLTRISPGVWFALPRTKEVPITITPHNTAAGGLQYELEEYEKDEFNRFNAYLLGGLDFEFYSEDSDLNITTGRLEGLFRYNMKNGLSLQVLDRYSRDNDRFDIGNSTRERQRKYDSNLLELSADYEISERLRAKILYDSFYLDYDDSADTFLDRNDNGLLLYGYLNLTEKSSFFINYNFIDITYDDAFKEKDNEQHFIYAGWQWASTEKTDLHVKLGYQKKIYDENLASRDDPDGFALELQGEHDFTQKTKLILVISRQIEETDSFVASGKTVLSFRGKFIHEFSDRLTGMIDFHYENADYDQISAREREDDRYFIRPGLQYVFNDWFMGELAYSFDTRESTDSIFDYDTNTIYIFLNFAL